MTWDQVGLAAECVARHHTHLLESLIEPIAAGFGVQYKRGKVRRGAQAGPDPAARDARLMAQLHAAGVPVDGPAG